MSVAKFYISGKGRFTSIDSFTLQKISDIEQDGDSTSFVADIGCWISGIIDKMTIKTVGENNALTVNDFREDFEDVVFACTGLKLLFDDVDVKGKSPEEFVQDNLIDIRRIISTQGFTTDLFIEGTLGYLSFDGYLSHKEDDSFLLDSESANPTVVSADIAITNQNVISYINKILDDSIYRITYLVGEEEFNDLYDAIDRAEEIGEGEIYKYIEKETIDGDIELIDQIKVWDSEKGTIGD